MQGRQGACGASESISKGRPCLPTALLATSNTHDQAECCSSKHFPRSVRFSSRRLSNVILVIRAERVEKGPRGSRRVRGPSTRREEKGGMIQGPTICYR